jgi:hypothetical protein
MTALGKYQIIEADTLEGIKRYRALIEHTLKRPDLRPDHRIELEIALKRAWDKQIGAQRREDDREIEQEERKKKKGSGEGDGTSEGSGGDQQGGGTGGDSRGGGNLGDGETNEDDAEDTTDTELVGLLLLMSEGDANHAATHDPNLSFAAATLMLDHDEGLAEVHESYSLRNENSGDARSDLLPSLERHAATLGARMMQLKVQPDVVPMFQQKLGYTPYGKMLTQKGGPLQRMRKTLVHGARLNGDVPA